MPRFTLLTGATLALLILAGCTGTPTRTESPVTLPATFSAGGEQPPTDRWWHDFDDPGLSRVIEQALGGNLSLRAAWARLDQARAVARREGAARWPTLDGRAEISRPTGSNATEQRLLGLAAAYEVDLWGRIGSTAEAAALDADASAADLQAAAISLSAEVATTWYQLVEQRAQLALLEEQQRTNRQLLELVQARFRIGQAAASDVHRQRQLLAQTQGERVQAESRLAGLRHQLAVLLGAVPGEVQLPGDAVLPAPGPFPSTGIPAELVRRRPDLQRALLRLQAADARAAAAVAARYPRLDLTASGTTSTPEVLFSNWLGNLAAQLAGPLFDGGQRRAEAERARAVVAENLNTFGEALLEAVREVETALANESGQRAYLETLRAQQREAAQVVERERSRYFQGDSDYLSVLDALRSRQQLERQQLTARRELLTERINLVRALAGGWPLTPPDPPGTAL